jgi:hypothetical protein
MSNLTETQAITKSYQAASPEWKDEAYCTVKLLSLRKQDFTTDEVDEILIAKGLTTKDKRALGGVMLKAAREGYIVNTKRARPSRLRSYNHGRLKTVWRPVHATN